MLISNIHLSIRKKILKNLIEKKIFGKKTPDWSSAWKFRFWQEFDFESTLLSVSQGSHLRTDGMMGLLESVYKLRVQINSK